VGGNSTAKFPNSRRSDHGNRRITVTFGVEEIPIPNSRITSEGGTTVMSVGGGGLPSLIPEDHAGITFTSGVQETLLHNSRRPKHGGITITCGAEDIPLPNYIMLILHYQHLI
jgi:hypothetical protein